MSEMMNEEKGLVEVPAEEVPTGEATVTEDSPKKKFTFTKKKKIIAGSVAVALLLIYTCGNVYFSKHYFPGTTINGVETGMKDEKGALKAVKDQLKKYKLTIHSEETDMTVTAEQTGLQYEQTENMGKLLKEQKNGTWFVEIFKKHKYKAMQTALNDEKLDETIDALACMKPEKPRRSERARIRYDEAKGEFVIKEAKVGNQVVKDVFTPAVKQAILDGEKTLDMTTNEYYKQPRFTSTSEKVLATKEKVDGYMNTVIHLKDGDRSYDITGKQIHNFIKISNDYKVTLKKQAIQDFLEDEVWDEMNTTDNAKIVRSPGSGVFYVADSSDAKVVRVRTEAEQIVKDIKEGKEITRKPDYMKDFLVSDYANIVGDTYVEISIGSQHVWAVQDGKVVLSTPVVTGNVSTGHASPTGIYTIKWKTTNYTMKKYNAHVSFWMPYDTQQGIGFHDATWRGSFGGNIYYYSGSHGCINMPYSAARSLYNLVNKGWVVIVH